MTQSSIEVSVVESEEDEEDLRTLLLEFQDWVRSYRPEAEIGISTEDFQKLDTQDGWAWIARSDGEPAGCVLLYGLTPDLAELKRLWVRPNYRGEGIGRSLTRTVIDEAQNQGYETLGLNTPPWADEAHRLYESIGFERTPPYPETPLPEKYHHDAIFMRFDLTDDEKNRTNK